VAASSQHSSIVARFKSRHKRRLRRAALAPGRLLARPLLGRVVL